MKEKGGSVKALQEYHSLCENAARLTGESIQSLDFIFSRFSVQGQRQHAILPICGSSPKCASCVLPPYCFYYRHFVKGKTPDETKLSIPYWRPEDRPREQLEQLGASRLPDSQLLAIILRTGMEKRSAVDLAKELLCRFGSLRDLAEASFSDLCRIRGIGKVKAIQIKAALEMGKRGLEHSRKDKTIILEGLDVFRQYKNEIKDLKQESFFLLILNSRNQVMKKVEISRGTLDASMVHPREVFREAIRESASSVIFYHNHPSGDPHPSRADILITERLKKSGEVLGIKVLDHIIMGEDGFYSFADQGFL
jgi:DNA repair protein RadC